MVDVDELVSFKSLTPENLRSSKIPDECVHSIWVQFETKPNTAYTAVHVYEHPNGHYILLSQTRFDYDDMESVMAEIRQITGQRLVPLRRAFRHAIIGYGDISNRNDDICTVIRLAKSPTQARVADLMKQYISKYWNVTAPVAYYHDVPRNISDNPGMPLEKRVLNMPVQIPLFP